MLFFLVAIQIRAVTLGPHQAALAAKRAANG